MPHNYQLERAPHLKGHDVDNLALHVNSFIFEDMANDQKIAGLIRLAMNNHFGKGASEKFYAGEVIDLAEEKVFADVYDQIESALLGRVLLQLGARYMEYQVQP